MQTKTTIKLPLSNLERANLRRQKIKIVEILNFSVDEIEVLLNAPSERAREIVALAQFQTVPSIGIKFAEDLIFMGFYSFESLKNKTGAEMTDEYERRKGYRIDPCVEDQFRLVVNFAQTKDPTKNWWDFTEARKKFRLANGYPSDRPKLAWHETLPYKKN